MSIHDLFEQHQRVVAASAAVLPELLQEAADLVSNCLSSGHKVLACGNGGSAADAQHFAAELLGRFSADRQALAAIALTTDSSSLTAIANDLDFGRVFSRQVEALGRPGDIVLAISTSGTSENVVHAARTARARGCIVVALTGMGGGELADHADVLVAVPSTDVARVQEVHALCLHAICGQVESTLAQGGGLR